jgi:hypothetical protein
MIADTDQTMTLRGLADVTGVASREISRWIQQGYFKHANAHEKAST